MLGLAFVVVDFCLVKILQKMYPHPNSWDDQSDGRDGGSSQRERSEIGKRLYDNAVSHRFRNGGLCVCLIGILLLITYTIYEGFRSRDKLVNTLSENSRGSNYASLWVAVRKNAKVSRRIKYCLLTHGAESGRSAVPGISST